MACLIRSYTSRPSGSPRFKHQVGSLRSHDLGIFAVLLDNKIGRAPDVDVRGYRQ